ncbi:MAG TPA: hypothetical protein DCE18_20950 [Syntrophobacteraceae bacterium]|nr:hypothetical protein [Syntrophobacteraceae bacterium]
MLAGLTFQSILATGSQELGDGKGPDGAGLFDLFFDNIDLPGFVDRPALLLLATKNVHLDMNFITINAPRTVTTQSYEQSKDQDWFVWRILPNPSDTWILQTHLIPSGKLGTTRNTIGIHTRNEQGRQARVRDAFSVARIFLMYHGSQ